MFDTLVFDLDGTLLDTLGDLAMAGNHTLEAMGLPVHETQAYRTMVGNGIPKLVSRMLPPLAGDATHEIALALFSKNYARHMNDTTAAYPGIHPMLKALKAAGFHLGVVSNKGDVYVQQIVEQYFPDIFDSVCGHRDGYAPKPDPTALLELMQTLGAGRESTLYIGDSNVDVETAHNAGVQSCGVLWGFRSRDELEAAGADYLIQSPDELPHLVGAAE